MIVRKFGVFVFIIMLMISFHSTFASDSKGLILGKKLKGFVVLKLSKFPEGVGKININVPKEALSVIPTSPARGKYGGGFSYNFINKAGKVQTIIGETNIVVTNESKDTTIVLYKSFSGGKPTLFLTRKGAFSVDGLKRGYAFSSSPSSLKGELQKLVLGLHVENSPVVNSFRDILAIVTQDNSDKKNSLTFGPSYPENMLQPECIILDLE